MHKKISILIFIIFFILIFNYNNTFAIKNDKTNYYNKIQIKNILNQIFSDYTFTIFLKPEIFKILFNKQIDLLFKELSLKLSDLKYTVIFLNFKIHPTNNNIDFIFLVNCFINFDKLSEKLKNLFSNYIQTGEYNNIKIIKIYGLAGFFIDNYFILSNPSTIKNILNIKYNDLILKKQNTNFEQLLTEFLNKNYTIFGVTHKLSIPSIYNNNKNIHQILNEIQNIRFYSLDTKKLIGNIHINNLNQINEISKNLNELLLIFLNKLSENFENELIDYNTTEEISNNIKSKLYENQILKFINFLRNNFNFVPQQSSINFTINLEKFLNQTNKLLNFKQFQFLIKKFILPSKIICMNQKFIIENVALIYLLENKSKYNKEEIKIDDIMLYSISNKLNGCFKCPNNGTYKIINQNNKIKVVCSIHN